MRECAFFVGECLCVPAFCKISVNVNESLINN